MPAELRLRLRSGMRVSPTGAQVSAESGTVGIIGHLRPTGSQLTLESGTASVLGGGGGDYLAPLYTLPTGITFNAATGAMDGTVYDEGAFSLPGTVFATVSDGNMATLQSAVNNCPRGQTIVVSGTYTGQLVIPYKAGTGWVYIVSSAVNAGTFPRAAGARAQSGDTGSMFTIQNTDGGEPAVVVTAAATGQAASQYRIVGMYARWAGAAGTTCYHVVSIGNDGGFGYGGGVAQDVAGRVPSQIVLDRCRISGGSGNDVRRCIAQQGTQVVIRDCYIDSARDRINGQDTQAIMSWNSPGTWKVINCYLEGAGENVMLGGSDGLTAANNINDVEVRRCYFDKPIAWQSDGTTVKNLLELKKGNRVLIEDCVFGTTWVNAQDSCWVFKSVNQDGGDTLSQATNITVRYCRITGPIPNALDFIGRQGGTCADAVNRVDIHHVLFENMTGSCVEHTPGAAVPPRAHDFRVRHVTFARPSGAVGYSVNLQDSQGNTLDGGWQFVDNVVVENSGVRVDGGATGATALDSAIGSGEWTMSTNVFGTATDNPGTLGVPVFVDRAGLNYALAGGSAGKAAASDGTDCGADVTTVLSRTATVIAGS